ncbi:MAG: ABC transporter ATP-binding protein [Lachnospiraceae bacterium]|nr:ABC transporter ATP-binding protein [Lachnospiraceae bacterium]
MARLTMENLSMRYTRNAPPALRRFSYEFEDGVYGLLGPNGAGKSTLMNLIVGNLKPTAGEVRYEGQAIESLGKEYRSLLGYMPQQQQLYENFTVKRFLYYFAALKGLESDTAKKRITELLELVNLLPNANQRLRSLSGGMKQRVLLAQALLNDPKVLILDEPTAGLDPKERMNIRNYIYSIAEGKTIILATHVISDIEQIAKETIFLRKGKRVLSGTPDEVQRAVSPYVFDLEVPRASYEELNRRFPYNRVIGEREGMVSIKIIAKEPPQIAGIRQAAVSLEDVYMVLYP